MTTTTTYEAEWNADEALYVVRIDDLTTWESGNGNDWMERHDGRCYDLGQSWEFNSSSIKLVGGPRDGAVVS